MGCNHCGYDHPMEPCSLSPSHEHRAMDTLACKRCQRMYQDTLPLEVTLREAIQYLRSSEGRVLIEQLDPSDTFMAFEMYNRAGKQDTFRIERTTPAQPPIAKGQIGWVDELQ